MEEYYEISGELSTCFLCEKKFETTDNAGKHILDCKEKTIKELLDEKKKFEEELEETIKGTKPQTEEETKRDEELISQHIKNVMINKTKDLDLLNDPLTLGKLRRGIKHYKEIIVVMRKVALIHARTKKMEQLKQEDLARISEMLDIVLDTLKRIKN